MTIHQLPKPCFDLDPSPYDDEYGDPHYKTWAEGSEALAQLREERGPSPEDLAELEPVKVKALAGPCWVAECDSPGCDEQYSDDDYGGNHFVTPEELIQRITQDGWTTGEFDWLVFCRADSPEDAPLPPPSPAELEAAGQLRLPGVA